MISDQSEDTEKSTVAPPLNTGPEPMTCSKTVEADPETVPCSEASGQADHEHDISGMDRKYQDVDPCFPSLLLSHRQGLK